jgi:hypothetical protein
MAARLASAAACSRLLPLAADVWSRADAWLEEGEEDEEDAASSRRARLRLAV